MINILPQPTPKWKIRLISCVRQLSECRRRLTHKVETSVLSHKLPSQFLGVMSARMFMNLLGIIKDLVV